MRNPKQIKFILIMVWLFLNQLIAGQTTENVVIITLDGFRWQEVFRGADRQLLKVRNSRKKMSKVAQQYWDDNPVIRRKKLMPFIWTELVTKGSLYGNRDFGSCVGVANRYWFSYPGYHEMLTGNPSKRINSNSLGPNPDVTILETINQHADFKDKVAVFSSWNAFPDILNEKRSGIFINSCFSPVPAELATSLQQNIERMYDLMPKVIGNVRYDGLTFLQAFEHLKNHRTRVLMIALGETDEFGHAGRYDQYLQSANRADRLLEEMWNWIQADSMYRNKTTLIITTDHGRGKGSRWRRHGRLTPHSNETWIAVLSPENKPLGEVRTKGRYYNAQIAATIAALINVPFNGNSPQFSQLFTPGLSGSGFVAQRNLPRY